MKKSKFLAIIPILLASTVGATEIYNKEGVELDLYGKINVRHFFSEKNNTESGDGSNINFGIRGKTEIFDNVTGFGRFELHGNVNKIEEMNESKNSLAYVGLKFSDFGSVDYGYNHGILYDIKSWTDKLPIYSSSYISQTNNYMSGYNRNLLTYRNSDFFGLFDGLNFALQYQGKNTNKNKSGVGNNLRNNGNGFGVSANYDLGSGLAFGGAYSKSEKILNDSEEKEENKAKNAEGWDVGVKYNSNNLYLAAMYGETYNMSRFTTVPNQDNKANLDSSINKTENIELVAQYLFDEINFKPSVAYVQSVGQGLLNIEGNKKQDLIKYVSLGAFYSFTKNLTALIDYKINLINKNDFVENNKINNDDLLGLGLTYKI